MKAPPESQIRFSFHELPVQIDLSLALLFLSLFLSLYLKFMQTSNNFSVVVARITMLLKVCFEYLISPILCMVKENDHGSSPIKLVLSMNFQVGKFGYHV